MPTACCSWVYPWSWSQVTACERSRRCGLLRFGLLVSSAVLSPFTVGESFFAVKPGSPTELRAFG